MRLESALPLILFAGLAGAQASSEPERAPGYAPLASFVGHWTTQGNETQFRENCDWYHGKFHVVCNAERKRADGSTGHSMSILSYVPGSGYVYSGIGSKGRYETFEKGLFSDGQFVFETTSPDQGSQATSRIVIGPFTDEGFLFVVTTSKDGSTWTEAGRTTYLRLK